MFHALFINLTWWQVGLMIIYLIYIICRSISIYRYGLKGSYIDYGEKSIKLYHIIWAVIDIPAIVLGKFFPVLHAIFSVDIYYFKEKKEEEDKK